MSEKGALINVARLDAELVTRKIAGSRERAKELIKSGAVLVNGKIISKPSADINETDEIISLAEEFKYVGRGGLKLEKAIDEFGIDLKNKICIDIGASTGGFTDCMLQNGAARVYAVDVGHDQLAEKLRNDARVCNAEGTDIRNITVDFTSGQVDFISIDVSFISLKLILPKAFELLKECGEASVLIKPQFEAGKKGIGKNGIVKDRKVHENVLKDITEFAVLLGFMPNALICSPIKGGSGNTEYLIHLKKGKSEMVCFNFRDIVDNALKQRNTNNLH